MSYGWGYGGWEPRKTVAGRRADAARLLAEAARKGTKLSPVTVEGRTIARTFWGKAWCDNLERYRDYANRIERGRSYVRSGSVVDLQIGAGAVRAQVSGSSMYRVEIEIEAVESGAWRAIQRDCAGSIGSLVDLLAGTLSESVMTRLCVEGGGLFPAPAAIRFTCSCPDYAGMCKHIAATMYGIGARLDRAPELLFTLRRVSADELLAAVARDLPAARPAPTSARVLADDGLAALFGIDLAMGAEAAPVKARKPPVGKKPAPVGKKPALVGKKPAPVAKKPTPLGKKPAPVGKKPAPVAKKPTPLGKKPTPLGKKSTPVGKTKPVVKKKAPARRA